MNSTIRKLKAETDLLKEEKERFSLAANDAEHKWKSESEKKESECQIEREKYDKVIDDIKAMHEEARKRATHVECQLAEQVPFF